MAHKGILWRILWGDLWDLMGSDHSKPLILQRLTFVSSDIQPLYAAFVANKPEYTARDALTAQRRAAFLIGCFPP